LRIATWNINSVRLRIDLVCRLLDEQSPDILCLQETKAPDETFPHAPLIVRGYGHIHIHGMKGYNGVAIISRIPLKDCAVRHWCERQDCRHAIATLADGTEIHNVYVPAGGDIPDPAVNDKFAHKLRFLDEHAAWFAERRKTHPRMILVGDLNVAPLETDVWSHKQLLTVVSHTPVEVEKFEAWRQSGGFVDAIRRFVPPEQKLFSWWSYRNHDWRASNRGRRLDHIWVTEPLAGELKSAEILPHTRDWARTSDHVPVIADFHVK
jgi:exodeoxyribonuclease-3